MTGEEHQAHERAKVLIRTLHAACEALVGDARFTLVLAVPVEGDPGSMAVETAGNGTQRLTEIMLARASLQHELARKNVDGAP